MRLINADAYSDKMRKKQKAVTEIIDELKSNHQVDTAEIERWNSVFFTFVEAKLTLDNAPTVDAVPVVHGHWIHKKPLDNGAPVVECSECGMCFCDLINNRMSMYHHYCPYCGAKMDGKDGDTE